jgi:hypothetical protein
MFLRSGIVSKPLLISSSVKGLVMSGSISILPRQVPVDDFRRVGAAARAAEGGALPGDQLERTHRDFLVRVVRATCSRRATSQLYADEAFAVKASRVRAE